MTGNFLIQCKTRKMEVLQFLAVAFGSYVFGIIVMMIIRANTMEENECVTLGMLIAMAALVFVHFFGIIFSFVGEFNMAISMGATRRAYVGSYALFNMAELAGLELLLFVLGKIESALMRVIYPQCEVILDLTQYFQWKYLLAVIVGKNEYKKEKAEPGMKRFCLFFMHNLCMHRLCAISICCCVSRCASFQPL